MVGLEGGNIGEAADGERATHGGVGIECSSFPDT